MQVRGGVSPVRASVFVTALPWKHQHFCILLATPSILVQLQSFTLE